MVYKTAHRGSIKQHSATCSQQDLATPSWWIYLWISLVDILILDFTAIPPLLPRQWMNPETL